MVYINRWHVFSYSLYFTRPDVDTMDVWNLCWIVGITDFVIKMAVVILKAIIATVPSCLIAHKNKVGSFRDFYRDFYLSHHPPPTPAPSKWGS